MKTTTAKRETQNLQKLRATLLDAVSRVDLKATDAKITQTMCIIDATFDAALRRKPMLPADMFALGMKKAERAGGSQI